MGKYREGSCWSRHYCGSGNIEKVPARAGTTAAVKKTAGEGGGGSGEGPGEEKAPAGASTAAAVREYR